MIVKLFLTISMLFCFSKKALSIPEGQINKDWDKKAYETLESIEDNIVYGRSLFFVASITIGAIAIIMGDSLFKFEKSFKRKFQIS